MPHQSGEFYVAYKRLQRRTSVLPCVPTNPSLVQFVRMHAFIFQHFRPCMLFGGEMLDLLEMSNSRLGLNPAIFSRAVMLWIPLHVLREFVQV